MNEMDDLLLKKGSDFVKHQGVLQMKSGKWGARIRHPITKGRIWLGSYDSPEAAADACSKKKLELESMAPKVKNDEPSLEESIAGKIPGSVYKVKRGKGGWKWRAEIRTKKIRIYVGVYATAEEARAALDRKRSELDSTADPRMDESRQFELHVEEKSSEGTGRRQSDAMSRPPGVFRRKSGRWFAEIRNPITKRKASVGTYETAEEAAEALKRKREEFGSMVKEAELQQAETKRKMPEAASVVSDSKDGEPMNQKRSKPTDGFCRGNPHEVYQRKLETWCADMQDLISKTKSSGGASMAHDEKKHELSNADECKGIDTNDDKKVRMASEDLYVGVIDAYGRLIGEFSRLDDELWLCRSSDDDVLTEFSEWRLSNWNVPMHICFRGICSLNILLVWSVVI